VITPDGQASIMSVGGALKLATEKGLDLVCINKTTNPPVCKMFDFKKFIFEQKKREKEQQLRVRQATIEQHVIKIDNISIGENDLLRLVKTAEKFLKEGDEVRIVFRLRGRLRNENNLEQPNILLKKFIANIKDVEFTVRNEVKNEPKQEISSDPKNKNSRPQPKELSLVLVSNVKKGSKNGKNEN